MLIPVYSTLSALDDVSVVAPAPADGQVLVWLAAAGKWVPGAAGGGTVTSVALSLPPPFAVAGSPVTAAGTLAVTLAAQAAGTVLAGPLAGDPAAPAFRALVVADIPAIPESGVTGLVSDLAAKAPLASPTFTGTPAAPTPAAADNSTALATTAFVKAQAYLTAAPVTSVAGRTGAVTLSNADVAGLGTAATHAATDFLAPTGNGSGLTGLTGSQITGNIGGSAASITGSITEAQVTNLTADLAAKALPLAPTAVKTTAYTLAAQDYVPADASAASVALTLPTAPADRTAVGVKLIAVTGTNTVTIATGAGDVFNKTGGSTSLTLSLLNQGVLLQYRSAAAVWYVLADDLPLAQLDGRYATAAQGALAASAAQSIALTTPNVLYATPVTFAVSGGVATGALTLVSQAANTFLAGPSGGSAAQPTMRAIAAADLPAHSAALITSGVPAGVLKGSAGAFAAATAGTDYLAPAGSGAGLTGIPTSVANSDGTLTVTPATGAVVASLNLAHANIWTGVQTYTPASASARALKVTTLGAVATVTTVAAGSGASSGTATITTSAAHGFAVGNPVTITGLTNTALNGTWRITAVTATTFSFTKWALNIAAGTADGGTATGTTQTGIPLGVQDYYGNDAFWVDPTGAINCVNGFVAYTSGSTYPIIQCMTNGGTSNTVVGSLLLHPITGNGFTTVGSYHPNTVAGNNNTAYGSSAMQYIAGGSNNTALGQYALLYVSSGSSNTALGSGSLTNSALSGISNNTGVGNSSGSSAYVGNNNTFLGFSSGLAGTTTINNSFAVGQNALVGASNAGVLGGTGSNSVVVGVNVATPLAQFHAVSNAAGRPAAIFQGAATPTTDVLQIQDSTTAVKSSFDKYGNLNASVRYGTIVTVADSANPNFDLSASDWQQIQLGGNRPLTISNPYVGQQFFLILQQDGTPPRTITSWFSGILWVNGTQPTLTNAASKRDVFAFKCISPGVYLGFVVGQNL